MEADQDHQQAQEIQDVQSRKSTTKYVTTKWMRQDREGRKMAQVRQQKIVEYNHHVAKVVTTAMM